MTPVDFLFLTPTGEPIANTAIEIQLSTPTFDVVTSGVLMPRPILATTDANGHVIVNLWPSTDFYYVSCYDTLSDSGLSYKCIVPTVDIPGTVVRFQDIVIAGDISPAIYDEVALLAIQNTKAITLAYQVAAAASAAEAAAAASTATDNVAITSADVLLTHADVVLTHVDAANTAADRVQTGLDRTAAAASAATTALAVSNLVGASWSGDQIHIGDLVGPHLTGPAGATGATGAQGDTGLTGPMGGQDLLVSGTNIKTINSESVLGAGDIAVQDPLVSGTNIKTINGGSVLGSGDITVQVPLVSGVNIVTINGTTLFEENYDGMNFNLASLEVGEPNHFQAGQSGRFVTITDAMIVANTFSLNFNQANNFNIVLIGNRILGNPNVDFPGQQGVINVYQDPTGSRTLTHEWMWGWAGGTAGVLSTAGCTKDMLAYSVDYYTVGVFTVTIATPGVFTMMAHGLISGQKCRLFTSGALPTGLNTTTTYFIRAIDANTFWLCTTLANVAAGTYIATSGSQSGTHTIQCASVVLALSKATP